MSTFSFRFHSFVLSQAADVEQTYRVLRLVVSVAAAIVMLSVLFVARRLFRFWLQAFFASAPVTMFDLLGMLLRRTPADQVVRWKRTLTSVSAGNCTVIPQAHSFGF